jgi:hypothetical protein
LRNIRRLITASLVMVAVSAAMAAPAHADSGGASFAAQARKVGLTAAEAKTLQAEVDTYIARVGGTQVSINKIDVNGAGSLTVPLPGEARAREVSAAGAVAAAATCPDRNFCVYSGPDLTGSKYEWYYCKNPATGGDYQMPWGGFGSYHNNQSPGTRAHFYDSAHNYMYDSLGAGRGGNDETIVSPMQWLYIWWVRPCGAP